MLEKRPSTPDDLKPTGRPELYYPKLLGGVRFLKPLALKLHPADNVAVALHTLEAGTEVVIDGQVISVRDTVPAFHKLALEDLSAGTPVVKYGSPVGDAKSAVGSGSWVHSHNLATRLSGLIDYRYEPGAGYEPVSPSELTFDGFVRSSGKVGTRNEIWVLPTVGCVNNPADTIARICNEQYADRIDGIYSFGHAFGCSQSGEDLENTRRVLAGLMCHPNAGGVLLLGLGCEDNQLESQLELADDVDRMRLRYFNSQDVEDEVEGGVSAVRELVAVIEDDKRSACPASDLIVGTECGGSDALSGITANPLVGRAADRLVAEGGGVILSEVPEMFGAEQTLMNRAVNETVFTEIVSLINDYKSYFTDQGCPIYENPSPGNLDGGLTTLEEKSLGAILKGGSAGVTEVIGYGGRKHSDGLALLNTPGNDPASCTALVAAGANVLLFTTGRGTPFGAPVPTIKISTNTALHERKPGWIDFNAGALADGTARMEELESDLLDLLLHVASGRLQTNNERRGFRDIATWKTGVTH